MTGGETEEYATNVILSSVGVDTDESVRSIRLAAPVPNPARDGLAIHFGLPRAADISLAAYDLAGRQVAEVHRGPLAAGVHRLPWHFRDREGSELPAGLDLIKLRLGDVVRTRQAIRVH